MPRDEPVFCVCCERHLQELAIRNVYVTDEGPVCGSCIDVSMTEDDRS